MHTFPFTALSTLLIAALLFGTGILVGYWRTRTKIPAPATTGHPMFERAYRVQMNTLEYAVPFLCCLWVFAIFGGDLWASGTALVWVGGRILYAVQYMSAPAKRQAGFVLSGLAFVFAFLGGSCGVIRALLGV